MRNPRIIQVPVPNPWARQLHTEAMRLNCTEADIILLAIEEALSRTRQPRCEPIDDE